MDEIELRNIDPRLWPPEFYGHKFEAIVCPCEHCYIARNYFKDLKIKYEDTRRN